ncbi:alginate export family protein [bacterium]|nr:alginate export family protein [bacterium]
MSAEELRRERQETIEELKRTEDVSGGSNFLWRGLSNATGWEIDYGGWYAPTYTWGDNGTDRDGARQDLIDHTWEHDLRTFIRVASATKKTKFYARLRTTSTINHRSSTTIDLHDYVQPTFDMMYMELARTGRTFKHTWTFGRQYAQVERGISFGLVADGLHYRLASRRNDLQFFILRQQAGDNNLDGTRSGGHTGRTKRMFYGTEWKWKIHPKYIGMGLSLAGNIDRNVATADGSGQIHQYDSLYYGLGFSGSLTSRLSYWSQYLMSTGKTYSAFATTASTSKINVDGGAYDIGLRYFFPTALAPTLYMEYAAGSGDADADSTATSTTGGSTLGKDQRFISFGGLSLGYALSPQLINIKVFKFGGSIKPFGWSGSRLWQELVVQPTFYSYSKDKASGATSDPLATQPSSKIGSEFDLTIAWRLAGDLKYQFRYGVFSPGASYLTKATEKYLKLKVSLDL